MSLNDDIREGVKARHRSRNDKLLRVLGDRMRLTPIEQAKREAVEARRKADEARGRRNDT